MTLKLSQSGSNIALSNSKNASDQLKPLFVLERPNPPSSMDHE